MFLNCFVLVMLILHGNDNAVFVSGHQRWIVGSFACCTPNLFAFDGQQVQVACIQSQSQSQSSPSSSLEVETAPRI
jgi:hypothetical protein